MNKALLTDGGSTRRDDADPPANFLTPGPWAIMRRGWWAFETLVVPPAPGFFLRAIQCLLSGRSLCGW